eukprot:COSAG02_NODE_249_length_27097_cov_30.179155_4_plen_138_part_00
MVSADILVRGASTISPQIDPSTQLSACQIHRQILRHLAASHAGELPYRDARPEFSSQQRNLHLNTVSRRSSTTVWCGTWKKGPCKRAPTCYSVVAETATHGLADCTLIALGAPELARVADKLIDSGAKRLEQKGVSY